MAVAGNIFYFDWEIALMEWLQANLGPGAISFLSLLSMFGEQLLMVVIIGFLYWSWDKEFGKFVGLNILVANVWNPLIKNVFLRLRPYYVSDKIDLLRLSLYGSLAAHEKKNRLLLVIAILLPLLVGFSRVVVGAHYPTDVLAGWLLGLIVILLIPRLQARIKNRWLFYGLLLLLCLPGFFYCTSDDYFTSFGMLLGLILAFPFEEKYVRFENTRSPIRCILRVVGGGAVYFGLNAALKLPFPSALLDSGTFAAHLIRTLRYTAVMFTVIALYPMVFKLTDRIKVKSEK